MSAKSGGPVRFARTFASGRLKSAPAIGTPRLETPRGRRKGPKVGRTKRENAPRRICLAIGAP